jgi:hypothetical protein
MINQVDMTMDKYGLSNFGMMVSFHQIVQIKRPISELLTMVIQRDLLGDKINLDGVVLRTFDAEDIRANDRDGLMELLIKDDISGEIRVRILAL